jgi:hypothetical protein
MTVGAQKEWCYEEGTAFALYRKVVHFRRKPSPKTVALSFWACVSTFFYFCR